MKRVLQSAIVLISLLLAASIQAGEPKPHGDFLVEGGYEPRELSFNASGGLDYLPNGDLLVSLDHFPLGNKIATVDANGDGIPAAPDVIGTLAPNKFGSFLKISPDGTFALAGQTAGAGEVHPIFKIDLVNRTITQIADIPFNYSLAFADNESVYISANDSFAPGAPNRIQAMNLNNPATRQEVASIAAAPSGGVAVNSVGDLYYIKATSVFPPPPGSHFLYKWEAAQIQSALDNQVVLHEDDAKLLATLDGGYGLVLNAFNDIFISDLNGNVIKVDEKNENGNVAHFSQFKTDASGYLTHIALYSPNKFFEPYQKSGAKLAVMTGKTTPVFDNLIVEYTPIQDDAFADRVLSFQPGAGGSATADLILGAPIGGGTASPDNSSLVLLGDRDNPNTSSPATVEVGFFNPISDDIRNKNGFDAIAFSNSFFSNGNPQQRFAEPALIEVSQDTNHDGIANDQWHLVLPSILPADLPNPLGLDLTLRNYAEFSPTLVLGDTNGDNAIDVLGMDPEDFYTVPDGQAFQGNAQSYLVDANSGGGDAFDLREAVAQASPGVPLVNGGRNEYVFLDRIDFIRLRDARKGDSGFGPATADIDAVSDAKSGIIGNTTLVSTLAQLQNALAGASEGDEIVIKPGVYHLNASLNVPLGVTLQGSEGLWTVNDEDDDTVLNGAGLPANTPAVILQDLNGNFQVRQGYGISGIRFFDMDRGIAITDAYPTIQDNFFEDVKTPIKITNAKDSTVVIRHNVLGHEIQNLPIVGIDTQNSNIAIVHNTFANFTTVALLAGTGSEVYLHNNIFADNQVAVNAQAGSHLSGRNNLFFGNAQDNVISSGNLTDNITVDPEFALAASGDYRLAEDSPARRQGTGGADPGVYDGPNFYPFDIDTGFFLDLKQFPWFQSLNDGVNPLEKYSGTAVAKMWLTYLWWNKIVDPNGPPELSDPQLNNQLSLFNYGKAQNDPVNSSLDRLDARGLWYTVQTLDPPFSPYHYNFGIHSRSNQEDALNDIAHWISYPAGGGAENPNGHGVSGHPVHVPAAVPTGGDYDHWVAVRGLRATENPWEKSRYKIFGFWINDPHPSGIGENSYKTVEQFTTHYFLPLTNVDPADPQFGKWVSIVEPPEDTAEILLHKEKKRLNRRVENFFQLQAIRIGGVENWVYVQDHHDAEAFGIIKAAVQGLQEELLDYDGQLAEVFERTIARKPLYVNDPQNGDYYLVVFEEPIAKSDQEEIENIRSEMRRLTETKKSLKTLRKAKAIKKNLLKEKWSKFQILKGDEAKVVDCLEGFGTDIRPLKSGRKQLLRNRTLVVAMIDAKDGHFKEASWVKEPVQYLNVSQEKAMRLLANKLLREKSKFKSAQHNPRDKRLRRRLPLHRAEIELVRSKSSLYHPDWKIYYEGVYYRISQKGDITVMDQ